MLALSTGSLHNYGLSRVFALAAETGYDGMEILVDAKWDSRDPDYLSRLCSEHSLPIVALHSPFVQDVQGWPPDPLGRLKKTVALAQKLNVPLVVTHLPLRFYGIGGWMHLFGYHRFVLPIPWPRRGSYYHFLRDGRLEEMESSSGVIVAVENMPARRLLGFRFDPHWFNRPRQLASFPHLTFDTAHLGSWGLNPVQVYEQLHERVAHVHLSNFDGRDHRSPVDGHLPLATFLRRLAQDSYPGAISVECSPDALQAEDEGKCRLELAAALTFCREHFSVGENRFE